MSFVCILDMLLWVTILSCSTAFCLHTCRCFRARRCDELCLTEPHNYACSYHIYWSVWLWLLSGVWFVFQRWHVWEEEFFCCSFFCRGCPRCVDSSNVFISRSVLWGFILYFNFCSHLRWTPVRAYFFVASRACFTVDCDRRWIVGMSSEVFGVQHHGSSTCFIARASVLIAWKVVSSVVQNTKDIHAFC